jgi:predicted nucleic acid-binding protein
MAEEAAAQTYVLDAFALLALFKEEPGADMVASLLKRAGEGQVRMLMCVVNLGEVIYRTLREYGQERSQEVSVLAQALAIEFVDVDRPLALSAAAFKGVHRMSYADCFAAALAQRESAAIVTGDPDFRQVEELVAIEWLPGAESQ